MKFLDRETDTLPDKPSELLELALHDFKICMKSKDYKYSTKSWHIPNGEICEICFGGAIMAQTLFLPKNQKHSLKTVPYKTGLKLAAVDNFATYEPIRGLTEDLGIKVPKEFIPPEPIYTTNGYSIKYLRNLIKEFKRCGI